MEPLKWTVQGTYCGASFSAVLMFIFGLYEASIAATTMAAYLRWVHMTWRNE